MRLAIDGASPVHDGEWPTWPPPPSTEQIELVSQVVRSGTWSATAGPLCDRFAEAFARRHGCAEGVCVVNGTMSLTVAMWALGLRAGDEVVMPGYTFVACATSALLMGVTPVFADVDPDHAHLSAATLSPAIGQRTKAVMVVHLAGSPAPMAEILDVTGPLGIPVIEDAAQAHGAGYRGQPAGSLSDVASFSFQASKAMTAGEGGLLATNDTALADRLWSCANVGRSRDGAWYGHPHVGWNLRMTEMQAALLLPWLDRLDEQIERRETFAARLSDGFEAVACDRQRTGSPDHSGARLLPQPEGTTRDSRHLAMIDLGTGPDGEEVDKQWVLRALAAEGVAADDGYPGLHDIPAVADSARLLPCPGLERVRRRVVWLRQSQLMADVEVADRVVEAVSRVTADPRAWGRAPA